MGHHHEHHDHNEIQNYLVQQIFTIAICALIGGVAVSLYVQGSVGLILHPTFHLWVVLGGIALLVMAFVRGIALWQLAGELRKVREADQEQMHDHHHHHEHHEHDHAHDHHHDEHHEHVHVHDHGHVHAKEAAGSFTGNVGPAVGLQLAASPALSASSCGHDHDHSCCDHDHSHAAGPDQNHDHDHDHDHDHGWAPWRFVLLLLPAALFFLNLPNEGFSGDYQRPPDLAEFDLSALAEGKEGDAFDVRFLDLELAAMYPDQRAFYNGKSVRLSGRYSAISEKDFTLVRYKINCCAADAIPLNAIILIDGSKVPDTKAARLDPEQMRNKWVNVTGRVQFLKRKDNDQYVTALIVTPTPEKPLSELVRIVPADPNPYAF